jgi:hypothetical protein
MKVIFIVDKSATGSPPGLQTERVSQPPPGFQTERVSQCIILQGVLKTCFNVDDAQPDLDTPTDPKIKITFAHLCRKNNIHW